MFKFLGKLVLVGTQVVLGSYNGQEESCQLWEGKTIKGRVWNRVGEDGKSRYVEFLSDDPIFSDTSNIKKALKCKTPCIIERYQTRGMDDNLKKRGKPKQSFNPYEFADHMGPKSCQWPTVASYRSNADGTAQPVKQSVAEANYIYHDLFEKTLPSEQHNYGSTAKAYDEEAKEGLSSQFHTI